MCIYIYIERERDRDIDTDIDSTIASIRIDEKVGNISSDFIIHTYTDRLKDHPIAALIASPLSWAGLG